MMRKATFIVGFGAGYVLGAKAGRARYEQIKRNVSAWMGTPAVQNAVQTVKQEAEVVYDKAKSTVADKVGGSDAPPPSFGSGAMAGTTSGTGRDPYPS